MKSFPPIALLLAILSTISGYSQQQFNGQPIKRCATFESMQELRQTNFGVQTDDQFEKWISKKIAEKKSLQKLNADNLRVDGEVYVIPIIFHIVHDNEAVGSGTNLSAAKITSQLNQLNADYANLSGSLWPQAANTKIQFCLARVSPTGTVLAEPGIERIDRNAKGWTAPPYSGSSSSSYVDVTIMPNSIWDPYKYFNVWTLNLSGGLLGKATFPSTSGVVGLGSGGDLDTHSGIMLHYASVGSISDPGPYGTQYGLGRTLTHESGHWLGLRHTWGDNQPACGNDYVDDTPPQNASTSGCPSPRAVSCGNSGSALGGNMHEAYMDYTDDNCVNTFTLNQRERMQAVMLNSPRRKELISSAACNNPMAIYFGSTTASVYETSTTGTGCAKYRDVTLNLLVNGAANGNATINFVKGGTATDGSDYLITPSFVSYTNGDNASKVINIRIYDDAAVENDETITLTFNITGTGVVAGNTNQQYTLTIQDNDKTPSIRSAGNVTLLSENFNSVTTGSLPAGWVQLDVFTPQGDNNWTVSANGQLEVGVGKGAHITNNPANNALSYTASSISENILATPLINASGLVNVQLSFDYSVYGEQDADDIYDFGSLMYSLNGTSYSFLPSATGGQITYAGTGAVLSGSANITLPVELWDRSFYIGFKWSNDASVRNNPPLSIDRVVISGTARTIESTVSSTIQENVYQGTNNYFYSGADGQLIARVQNASADVGCVTATVTQQGSGQALVTTVGGSYQRTQKVFQLSPSIANTTATYTATLYFTIAELAVWGTNDVNLKILKVTDGVNLGGMLSAANSQVITPTAVVKNITDGYISYTANFTGFSQFMLASPSIVLPVELLTFEATGIKSAIRLNWTTSQEINNKGFVIERSMDGISFSEIGWMDGQINSSRTTSYVYTDYYVQPNTVYYYRLRQTDLDYREKLSAIRQARISGDVVSIIVSPNPAKEMFKLYVSGGKGSADILLLNSEGQIVRKWENTNVSGSPISLDIRGLSAGIYYVKVESEGVSSGRKLVISR